MRPAIATLDRSLPLAGNPALSRALWIAAFAALTCAGAAIRIPVLPVPFTLQTPFVLLAGALLGARAGAASQIAYLALGACGLPVFAFGGGAGYLVASPTAGYLLAFPLAAWLCGAILHQPTLQQGLPALPRALLATAAGTFAIFTLGTLVLSLWIGLPAALADGFARLQLWDAVKICGTAMLATGLTASRTAR